MQSILSESNDFSASRTTQGEHGEKEEEEDRTRNMSINESDFSNLIKHDNENTEADTLIPQPIKRQQKNPSNKPVIQKEFAHLIDINQGFDNFDLLVPEMAHQVNQINYNHFHGSIITFHSFYYIHIYIYIVFHQMTNRSHLWNLFMQHFLLVSI